jgi:HlyD family secretion protein
MTAQVRLVVGNRPRVLRIPTVALRFRPSDEELEKQAKKQPKDKPAAAPVAPAPEDDLAFRTSDETARMFKVYRLDDKNEAKPVDIRIGLSNFRYTEVLAGLKSGDKVITRALAAPGQSQ